MSILSIVFIVEPKSRRAALDWSPKIDYTRLNEVASMDQVCRWYLSISEVGKAEHRPVLVNDEEKVGEDDES